MTRLMALALISFALAACAADPVPTNPPDLATLAATETPPTATTAPMPVTPVPTNLALVLVPGVLYIDGFDIVMLQSVPVEITVLVRGNLADGCTQVGDITQRRDQQVFYVVINAVRPRDAACTDALVPFERAVPLDVAGLRRGKYTIDVNGSRAEFELQADN